EESIFDPLRAALEREGFAVTHAGTVADGLEAFRSASPELVLLDVMLPDGDGRDVLRQIRASSRVPVVMLTARGGEMDKVVGLELGADDYVVKPFSAAQLDARIRAVLRRGAGEGPADTEVVVGGLRIDPRTRQAGIDGRPLELTPREFDLLHYLAARAGRVVSKRELLTEVWQLPYGGADKTVDVHLSWLRRKLGETAQQARYLHSVRGVGVRITAPAAPAPGAAAEPSPRTGD
ncbi:MAG TPA: response regulator transcription factor, partial [Pseudonocardia sp.]|nr:response regulator transcription factor [Pseudonocardia sp.]